MRPPVRPPQLRCVFFSSMYLPHLLVLPATFWTSVPFATLSVFPSLICGSCPSGQRFAYSFFQIPSHGGHPCCSAMCFVVAYAHLGLSPIRKRPCWANKIPAPGSARKCTYSNKVGTRTKDSKKQGPASTTPETPVFIYLCFLLQRPAPHTLLRWHT